MKNFLTLLILLFIGSQLSYGQPNFFNYLSFEANLNISNKKRSYGVYSGDKYANSDFFVGYDLGISYHTKLFVFGGEFFSPYRHFNARIGYKGLILDDDDKNYIIRIIPDFKLGYSPILKKVYYGVGAGLNIKWFTISYSKIFHVKSGSSKYHGDGLNVISAGVSLKINNKKE